MPIVDLTGTKWIINNSFNTASGNYSYNINFISNETSFTIFKHSDKSGDDVLSYNDTQVYVDHWTAAEAYKTIEITGGSDAVNASLISWLQENALQVTDIVGTISKIQLPNLDKYEITPEKIKQGNYYANLPVLSADTLLATVDTTIPKSDIGFISLSAYYSSSGTLTVDELAEAQKKVCFICVTLNGSAEVFRKVGTSAGGVYIDFIKDVSFGSVGTNETISKIIIQVTISNRHWERTISSKNYYSTSQIDNKLSNKQNTLTTLSVNDGTLNKAIGFDSNGNLVKGDAPGGTVTDVQINSTSIITSGVANIVTETAYDASSNKIATMTDLNNVGASVTDLR